MADGKFSSRSIEVWYDGDCALCRGSRDWCLDRDLDGRLSFRDIRTSSDAQLPVTRDHAAASLWVRQVDGTLWAGFDGWRRILAELPRWRWLSAISGLPPLRWLGPQVYRLIAAVRHRIPRRPRFPA